MWLVTIDSAKKGLDRLDDTYKETMVSSGVQWYIVVIPILVVILISCALFIIYVQRCGRAMSFQHPPPRAVRAGDPPVESTAIELVEMTPAASTYIPLPQPEPELPKPVAPYAYATMSDIQRRDSTQLAPSADTGSYLEPGSIDMRGHATTVPAPQCWTLAMHWTIDCTSCITDGLFMNYWFHLLHFGWVDEKPGLMISWMENWHWMSMGLDFNEEDGSDVYGCLRIYD